MATRETSEGEIVRAMTGRSVNLRLDKAAAKPGDVVLEARDLTVASPGGRPLVDKVSLSVRAGEIVGIAGVAGNGQTELVEALIGARSPDAGAVLCAWRRCHEDGRRCAPRGGPRAIFRRIAPRSERRFRRARRRISPSASSAIRRCPRRGLLDRGAMARRARDLIHKFGIRIGSEQLPVGTLSGGNLQKVVVARELSHTAPVLIAEQPTRGVDVGAIEFIHGQLLAERDRGCAILLVSAELSEIMALSDRILVMYEGRILADVPGKERHRTAARPADGRPHGGGGVSAVPSSEPRGWSWLKPPPVVTAIVFAIIIGGILVFVSGANPVEAYFEILVGALAPRNLPNTLNWAVPLVGMTLVAAIPLRGGMINLGGDGQMVIGGLVAALVPLYLPAPGPVLTIAALLAAAIAAGLYAALAAWGEARHGIPTLISSLLLSYPAVGLASYIVGFPLRDTTTGLAQTVMIPAGARLPVISGPLNAGFPDRRADRGAGDLRRSANRVRLRAPHARRQSCASPPMAACRSAASRSR